ncbi:MAG: glutamine--fructose-6-phosphate transaminase (isomerizing), partial [Thermoplasmata archaeon M9B2D]
MCGIIGYLGNEKSIQVVIEGLKNLEYRGYDSAGVAFFKNGNLDVKRCKGKIKDLISSFGSTDVSSHLAIGHTRWATHGKPSENNAHPHKSGPVVVVHNGIIENYLEVKSSLENDGFIFTSETDTEALCHLIEKYHRMFSLEDSVVRALNEIKGSYAIAVLSEKEPDRLVCARKDSPLVLGIGNGEYFVASDVPAFLNYCRNVIFMENDEYAVLSKDGVELKTLSGDQVYRDSSTIMWTPSMAEKGGFKHFMLKEIFEQPRAISDTVRGRYSLENGSINLAELGLEQIPLTKISKIFLVACGTSWHACTIGKYLIEELSGIPVEVDIASEFRYRNPLVKDGNLFIAVSQSGETADTLAALREARRLGARTMTICNVVGSSAAREAEAVFYTHSGPEIGVASTKAFLTQI